VLKVLHLSYSCDTGAGIAVDRLHKAQIKSGLQSDFIFFRPFSRQSAKISWVEKKVNGLVNILINKCIPSESLNLFPTSILRVINSSDADVVHLHWIHGEMMSISQIGKIKKPVVWTFHDMWPLCGSEHYVADRQYVDGYRDLAGESISSFFKSWIRRWRWEKKMKVFSHLKCQILTPSKWMTDCTKESFIFRGFDCHTVPNWLETDIFKPLGCVTGLRSKYGLPEGRRIILFGASRPDDARKGWDLLVQALEQLSGKKQLCLVVFGKNGKANIAGIQTVWLGSIEGDKAMAEVYNCADIMCVPSRQETFGQTASEPQACGVPVVAFNATGLKDVVEHQVTGYLAKAFDPMDFANGINWVLNENREELAYRCRNRIEQLFEESVVAKIVVPVYRRAIEQ